MNKQGQGGIEQRVWMHWKSLKGYHYPSSPNGQWLRLARVHKMKVRQIKDIISKRRGYHDR